MPEMKLEVPDEHLDGFLDELVEMRVDTFGTIAENELGLNDVVPEFLATQSDVARKVVAAIGGKFHKTSPDGSAGVEGSADVLAKAAIWRADRLSEELSLLLRGIDVENVTSAECAEVTKLLGELAWLNDALASIMASGEASICAEPSRDGSVE